MNARFAQRHEDLLLALFLALRDGVCTCRIRHDHVELCTRRIRHDHVERIMAHAPRSDAATVRAMLEFMLDIMKADSVADAVASRRAPTMQECAECMQTPSR